MCADPPLQIGKIASVQIMSNIRVQTRSDKFGHLRIELFNNYFRSAIYYGHLRTAMDGKGALSRSKQGFEARWGRQFVRAELDASFSMHAVAAKSDL